MKRDSIFDWISLKGLKNLYSELIGVGNKARYSDAFTFDNPRDIPDLGTVQALLGSGINSNTYSGTDLEDDGGGGFYLPYELTDGEIILGIRIDYDGGGSSLLPASYDFTAEGITGFPNNSAQSIKVFATGVYAPPTPLPLPVFTLQPTPAVTVVQSDDLTLVASASDAITYQWYKDGVQLIGETSGTLNIYGFTFGQDGTYKLRAFNGDGAWTDSDNSVVTYDAGRAVINRSQLKSDLSPNGAGRTITVYDGIVTKSINAGATGYFPTATASFDIKQAGSDALTIKDGFYTYSPVLGGNVSNLYSAPFYGPLYLYNDN